MPKLLYAWYFEKFTASVTSSYHSALRHEVSRICTILNIYMYINIRECTHNYSTDGMLLVPVSRVMHSLYLFLVD